MKANYIKTMDFVFEDVVIYNDKTEKELFSKLHSKTRYNVRLATKKGVTIKENEVIKILNGTEMEYINSSYIMYFKLEDCI